MKILFISNLFPDSRELYRGQDNANLLHAFPNNYIIRVISPRPSLRFINPHVRMCRNDDSSFMPVYCNYLYVPKFGTLFNHIFYYYSIRKCFLNCVNDYDPQIIVVSWTFPDSVAVVRLAQEQRKPVVVITQGSDIHIYLRMPCRSRVILDALENANAIITRSGKLASLIKGMSHSINNVYPIYNGVNQNIFKFSPSDKSIEKCKNNINQLFLLYVGNFYKVKNPELLIRALSLIIKDYPDIKIKLNMIGEGYLLERMRNLVANLALQEHVHLLGRKTSQEIANYMQISDLLCIPSFNEGLPNVLLESLSCGLPVVSTNVGGISEVLSETRYGSLVNSFEPRNFADAIIQRLRLTEDPTKIINYAQRFSWDTTVQSHIKVFNDVIDAE